MDVRMPANLELAGYKMWVTIYVQIFNKCEITSFNYEMRIGLVTQVGLECI
jgi:hypothetical protein